MVFHHLVHSTCSSLKKQQLDNPKILQIYFLFIFWLCPIETNPLIDFWAATRLLRTTDLGVCVENVRPANKKHKLQNPGFSLATDSNTKWKGRCAGRSARRAWDEHCGAPSGLDIPTRSHPRCAVTGGAAVAHGLGQATDRHEFNRGIFQLVL